MLSLIVVTIQIEGVSKVIVKAKMSLNKRVTAKVIVGSVMCHEFSVKVGVHQGSALSPLFFAIVVNVVTEDAKKKVFNEILYTDDLELISEPVKDLQKKSSLWKTTPQSKGMKVNINKTKLILSGIGETSRSKMDPCSMCSKRVIAS